MTTSGTYRPAADTTETAPSARPPGGGTTAPIGTALKGSAVGLGGPPEQERAAVSDAYALRLALVVAFVACTTEVIGFMTIPMTPVFGPALGASPAAVSWILMASLITQACCLGALTRLGDKYGPRRLFLITLGLLTVGSAICALADNITVMVIGRVFIGANAGIALGLGILKARVSPAQFQRGMGIVTAGYGIGVMPAFLLGGALLEADASLHTVFWVATALAALATAVVVLLPEAETRAHDVVVDWPGAGLLGAWLVAVALGLSKGNEWGWSDRKTLLCLLGGLALAALWLVWESRCASPVVPVRLLRGQAGIGILLEASIGYLAFTFYLGASTFVQIPEQVGYGFTSSVLGSAFFLLPLGIVVLLLAPWVGMLNVRTGSRLPAIVGSLVITVAFAMLALMHNAAWQVYLASAVMGVGVAFVMTTGWCLLMAEAHDDEGSSAGGLATVMTTIAGALAVALITLFLSRELIPHTPVPVEGGFTNIFIGGACAGAVTLVASLFIRRRSAAELVPAQR